MHLTIPELARAVDKSENYVRQHIFRKHLDVQKDGRSISVALDEASRWASERRLPFNPPTSAWQQTEATKERIARITVLALARPQGRPCNLLTMVRHRRRDALGPWSDEPGGTWESEELGNGLRLSALDAPLEHCRALIEDILQTAMLTIDGEQINYMLESNPRQHRAYRDECGLADAPLRSPFVGHSAEIVEYWSFAEEARRHWLDILDSRRGRMPLELSRLGFPLDSLTDRVGNLMIAGAEDAMSCDLDVRHDRILVLRIDGDGFQPGAYRATVWASHAGDEVLRKELAVTQRETAIKVHSDVDHVGFAIYRNIDGQCIDLMAVHLLMQIGGKIKIDSGPTLQVRDRKRRRVHDVTPAAPTSGFDLSIDFSNTEFDRKIRQERLERQLREREEAARREGNVARFAPDEFGNAVQYYKGLLSQDSDQKTPIYLADPYLMKQLTDESGTDWGLDKLCMDMFAASAGTPLRILCTKEGQHLANLTPWWSSLPDQIKAHVSVRVFLSGCGKRRAFHDRFLITPKREIIITNSLNGWSSNGVTFISLSHDVYRAEAEQLWSISPGTSTSDFLVKEIGR